MNTNKVTKIIIKSLPVILIVLITQPLVYFIWYWFKDWYYPVKFLLGSLILIFVLFLMARLASPSLQKVDKRVFLVVIMIIFGISRLTWILLIPTLPVSDFYSINEVAKLLATGHPFPKELTIALSGWGYPYFLALIYKLFGLSNLLVVKLVNLLLGLVSILLLFWLAEAVNGSRIARWVVLLFVLWPAQWMFSSVLASEHLAIPLMLGGLLLSIKAFNSESRTWLYAILGAGLLTLAIITRTAIVFVIGGILFAALLSYRPIKRTVYISATILGSFILMYTFYLGVMYMANDKLLPNSANITGVLIYMGTSYPYGVFTWEDSETVKNWPENQYLEYGIRASIERLTSYTPKMLATLVLQKNYIFWALPQYGYLWSTNKVADTTVVDRLPGNGLLFSQYLFQIGILLSAIWGLVNYTKWGYSFEIAIVLIILVLVVLNHIVMVTDSRYLYIFQPLLFIIAANGLIRSQGQNHVNKKPDSLLR